MMINWMQSFIHDPLTTSSNKSASEILKNNNIKVQETTKNYY